MKRKVQFRQDSFKAKPQQIIRNHVVAKGLHYSENMDFCIVNMVHCEVLLNSVEQGTHIALQNDWIEDKEDYKQFLTKLYKKDILKFKSNLINLTFSEN